MDDEATKTDEGQNEKVYHCPNCNHEFSGEDVPADMKCPDCDTEVVEGNAPDDLGEEEDDWEDLDDDGDSDEDEDWN